MKSRMSENKDAIKYLKEAEFYAEKTNDYSLKMRICHFISNINMKEENYTMALEYEQKAQEYSKIINDKELLGICFITISSIYGHLDKEDSAIYYIEKCLPLIVFLAPKQQAMIYVNIAASTEETDTAKARKYALKAIGTNPTNNAYQILARIEKQKKNYEQAEKYLYEALKYCKSIVWEAFITYELSQVKKLAGKHNEANELYEKAIELYDSINEIRNQDSIKEKQMAYDIENKNQAEIKTKDNTTIMITGTLTVIIIAVVAAYIVKRRKHRKKMDCAEKEIEIFKHNIKKIEKEKLLEEEKVRKIEAEKRRMQRLIAKQEAETERQKQLLIERNRTGHNIYNKVKEGTAAVSFDKEKISCLLAYYETIAPDFRSNTDAKYKNISEYQYVILIMKDMKLSNRQIATVLGITDNAVRTQMSRINKNAKEYPPKNGPYPYDLR